MIMPPRPVKKLDPRAALVAVAALLVSALPAAGQPSPTRPDRSAVEAETRTIAALRIDTTRFSHRFEIEVPPSESGIAEIDLATDVGFAGRVWLPDVVVVDARKRPVPHAIVVGPMGFPDTPGRRGVGPGLTGRFRFVRERDGWARYALDIPGRRLTTRSLELRRTSEDHRFRTIVVDEEGDEEIVYEGSMSDGDRLVRARTIYAPEGLADPEREAYPPTLDFAGLYVEIELGKLPSHQSLQMSLWSLLTPKYRLRVMAPPGRYTVYVGSDDERPLRSASVVLDYLLRTSPVAVGRAFAIGPNPSSERGRRILEARRLGGQQRAVLRGDLAAVSTAPVARETLEQRVLVGGSLVLGLLMVVGMALTARRRARRRKTSRSTPSTRPRKR